MRYCNHCHRITTGEALFCNYCGRSYDAKLCPHRHPNPRSAEICSQCGSRELSTPHPKVPVLIAVLFRVLPLLPALVLFTLTLLFAIAFAQALATSPELQFRFLLAALLLAFVWYLYMHLPHFLRHLIARLFRRKRKDDHHGH